MKKELEDIKGVIMMDSQYHGEIKRTKEQTMIYKTLDRKLKIEQYKHHKISGGGEGGGPMCSERASSSFSNSGTSCATLVTNQLISIEWGNDGIVLTTKGNIFMVIWNRCW